MSINHFYHRVIIILFLAIPLMFSRCVKEESNTFNHLPTARYEVSPERGDVGTQFVFDASEVTDAEDPSSLLQVRWDWNNDGIYDTDFSTEKSFMHQYNTTGMYFPVMQVLDSKGLSDSVSQMIVVVSDLTNMPPAMPAYRTPPNWQNWMEPDVIFRWTCSDPEDDSLTFELHTGRSTEAMHPVLTGITEFNLDNGQKIYETAYSGFEFQKTYYWQIFAHDIAGNYTAGPIWRFTTRPE